MPARQPLFAFGSNSVVGEQFGMTLKFASLAAIALTAISGCDSPRSSDTKTSSGTRAATAPESQIETVASKLPDQVPARGFLSSQACRRCHEKSHDSWYRSFHRTMTQLPSPDSIKAPFDGRKLIRGAATCSVEQRGNTFWVTVPDPEIDYSLFQKGAPQSISPPLVEREVVLVTGSHHMQIFWLPSNHGNELLIFPWIFSIDEQRWIPYEDSFVTPPTNRRMRASWNSNCIACHSVDGKPNFDFNENRFQSEVVEFGISCEACHGPGESHVKWHEDPRPVAEKEPDPVVHPGHAPTKVAAQICGQCHSDFMRDQDYYVNGPRFRAGGDLNAAQTTIDFEARNDPGHAFHNSHWEDGTARVGGREYLSMAVSECFLKGELTCVTCHSMHHADPNQQLIESAKRNDVCLQCHVSVAQNISAHTHHPTDSSGSECYNCHMPRTSFALFRAMRSHRVDIPSAANSHSTGRPNACNLCHLDKSLSWTAERLKDWYGTKLPEWKVANQADVSVAASIEWLLKGDAVQRVVTAWHYGWQPAREASGDNWEAPLLAHLLSDSYSGVRLVAGRSLKTLPNMSELQFDFLAPDTDRQAAMRQAIEYWRSAPHEPARDAPAVLQLDAGELNEQAIHDLLQAQDRRNITLNE